ncbi:MAG: DUF3987 domain-containing protein [Alphaproteobacteria bacterium]
MKVDANSILQERGVDGLRAAWDAAPVETFPPADCSDHHRRAAPLGAADPVDLWRRHEPPDLPAGLLPDVIERFARTTGKTMGADPGGIAAAALAVCAAATSDNLKLRMKRYDPTWREAPRIWVALVGMPSTKKTPMISAAARPLIRIDANMHRAWAAAMTEYAALPKDEKAAAVPPRQTRLRIEDATIESAQEVAAASPDGLLLMQDEMSGWFGRMDAYSGAKGGGKDRAYWLQSFNGGPYAVNRIGRGSALIENASVCMLGGIQPDPIRRVAADAHDDGLLQRMFPIVLRPAVMGRDEPMPPVVAEYGALVERLHGLGSMYDPEGEPFWLDDQAQEIRRALEQRHLDMQAVEAVHPKLAAHFGKLDGLFGRLCLLWHAIEHAGDGLLPHAIGAETAQRVADFLHRFLVPHAVAFYCDVLGLSADHDRLQSVAGYILAHPDISELAPRDFQRGTKLMKAMDRHEVETVAAKLISLGWLEPAATPVNGTAPRWAVNPTVHRVFADRARREAARRNAIRERIADVLGDTDDD